MKRILAITLFALLALGVAFGQTDFRPPTVIATNGLGVDLNISWTAGKVNNGGHILSVAAGSTTVTGNRTSCAAPAWSACNFVYVNNAGTIQAVTNNPATAGAAGNTILAFVETSVANKITAITYPWQSGSMWTGFPQGVVYGTTVALGGAGVATGQLELSGTTSGTVTVKPQDAAGTYNFNLPTAAGTTGQPLLSGGGGAGAMTFGTVPVAYGGTNLTAGTSGGVLGYTAAGTLASSSALTANSPVLGGGAGATPKVVAGFTTDGTSVFSLGVAGTSSGGLNIAGSGSGVVSILPQAAAGTFNFNLPVTAGTAGQALLSGGGGGAAHTYGTLLVGGGGTGLTTGTDGGIPAFTAATTITSSGALTLNGIVLGGGAGATPKVAAGLTTNGTSTLSLGVAGTSSGGLNISGSGSGTISILPQAAAGTFNFNLPAAAGTAGEPLLSGGGGGAAQTYGTLGVAHGGTGLTTGTDGGILGYTAAGTIASSTALTANVLVKGGGAGVTPGNSSITDNGATVATAEQVVLTIATGTPPFAISSTTPVTNLTTAPATYSSAGVQMVNAHAVVGKCTLGTNCGITLAGAAAFTGADTYSCVAVDDTAANAVETTQTNGTDFTFTGTGVDVLRYVCIGY